MKESKTNLSKILLIIPAVIFISLTAYGYNSKAANNNNSNVLLEKSFNTSPGKTFHIEASFGDVRITTTNDSKVTLKIKGNESSYKKLEIEFKNNDSGVSVIAKKKSNWNIFNFWGKNNLIFELTIPKEYNVDAFTSGGDMNVEGLTGKVELHTSGGDINLSDINGPTKVKTSGGDITLKNITGASIMKTSGGDIVAQSFNGNLDASTSGGDISLSGSDAEIKASTSGGDIQLNYSGSNKGISLYSSGGDIEVKLPKDFTADAKLTSSGGSVRCKFKMSEIEEVSSHKMIGKFNGGGEPLTIKTSGGSIEVR